MTPPRARLHALTGSAATRAETVAELRRRLSRIEGLDSTPAALAFGLPALDRHLPQGGLAFGALHEIAPETEEDRPAALGFLVALLARAPPSGPLLVVLSPRGLARSGKPSGHGLNALGLDPARVLLVETKSETEALWATEEALRSGLPAAVAATLGARLDLKTSQRLQVAAREAGRPLLILRPPAAEEAPTATTRWRIASAESARDRFGLAEHWRWRATLARCRNGRPGEWILEYDHATHRFSLAAALAHRTLPDAGDARARRRAG